MEEIQYFQAPKEWSCDSSDLIPSIKLSFDANAKLSSDNKNIILYVHSIIEIPLNKVYHYEVRFLISVQKLIKPYENGRANKNVYYKYIAYSHFQNKSNIEKVTGKKCNIQINEHFILSILDK